MFSEKVYALCKKVPRGKVTTYAEIAKQLNTKAYQAIGQILKRNPYAPIIPCHRVIKSDGTLGGFFGRNIKQKMNLLTEEGIIIEKGKIDLRKFGHKFKAYLTSA